MSLKTFNMKLMNFSWQTLTSVYACTRHLASSCEIGTNSVGKVQSLISSYQHSMFASKTLFWYSFTSFSLAATATHHQWHQYTCMVWERSEFMKMYQWFWPALVVFCAGGGDLRTFTCFNCSSICFGLNTKQTSELQEEWQLTRACITCELCAHEAGTCRLLLLFGTHTDTINGFAKWNLEAHSLSLILSLYRKCQFQVHSVTVCSKAMSWLAHWQTPVNCLSLCNDAVLFPLKSKRDGSSLKRERGFRLRRRRVNWHVIDKKSSLKLAANHWLCRRHKT